MVLFITFEMLFEYLLLMYNTMDELSIKYIKHTIYLFQNNNYFLNNFKKAIKLQHDTIFIKL